MLKEQKVLLRTLSDALEGKTAEYSHTEPEWEEILSLAKAHSVLPLVSHACPSVRTQMSRENWQKWFCILVAMTVNNKSLIAAQSQVVKQMAEKGIPCAILKGTSLAVCYSDPLVRTLGDIDLLVAPQYTQQAVAVLQEQGFTAPEESYAHPYHIDFYKKKTVVELHFAVSTFPDSAAGAEAKSVMEECWQSIQQKRIENHVFPCLSDLHQALSLMLHMERHMTTGCIGLRQLCDWAAFVKSVPQDHFREQILPALERCGLAEYACVLTKSCVRYLGIDPDQVAWCGWVKDRFAEAMMQEILRTGSISNKDNNDDVSSLFVESSGEENAIRVFIKKINAIARRKFPITQKVPVLLPVFWFYIPIRYWIRSLAGKRRRKSVWQTIAMTKQRKKLYKELKLFKTEE